MRTNVLPWRTKLLSVLLVWSTLSGAGAQVPAWVPTVDAYLEEEIAQSTLPGAAVAIVDGDGIVYARGFGTTTLRGSERVTPDTAFEIGSLTKSMTALAVLQLAEEGRVELDAPVQRYLPWFRLADEAASARITLRHLLTHTSGLPTNSHGIVWRDPDRIDGSIEEGVRALATVGPTAAPGERLQYANTGYGTLGAVIEAVTGVSWAGHLRENVLHPLGMDGSGLTIEDQASLPMATPYTWRLARQEPTRSMSAFLAPAGSTPVASARDMARFLQAWIAPVEGGAITPWAVERATEPLVAQGPEHYGLGLVVAEQHGERVIYHTGGTIGSGSYMAFLPEHELGVIVLSNSLGALAPVLGRGVLDVVMNQAPRPVGTDPARIMSIVTTAIGVVGLLLLALLAGRATACVRGRAPTRAAWVLWLRAGLLTIVAGLAWFFLPEALALSGLPAPFGVVGYPVDIAIAALSVLLTPTLWALYALATLVVARRGRRRSDSARGVPTGSRGHRRPAA